MSSVTKQFASLARGIRRIILHLSGALFTTRQSLDEPSLTIQTTSILKLKRLLSFINTGGRSNCFSNGSNSISASRLFGENPRMQSVFRYMLPSSHIASLVSSNMTCKLVVPSWKSCESWAALCSPWMMSETCLNHSNERKRSRTTGNSVLTFNPINIH